MRHEENATIRSIGIRMCSVVRGILGVHCQAKKRETLRMMFGPGRIRDEACDQNCDGAFSASRRAMLGETATSLEMDMVWEDRKEGVLNDGPSATPFGRWRMERQNPAQAWIAFDRKMTCAGLQRNLAKHCGCSRLTSSHGMHNCRIVSNLQDADHFDGLPRAINIH